MACFRLLHDDDDDDDSDQRYDLRSKIVCSEDGDLTVMSVNDRNCPRLRSVLCRPTKN